MKKFLMIVMIIAMVALLCACGRTNVPETTQTEPSIQETDPMPHMDPTILDPTILDPTFETNIPDPSVDTRIPDDHNGTTGMK